MSMSTNFQVSFNLKELKEIEKTGRYGIYKGGKLIKEFNTKDEAKDWIKFQLGEYVAQSFDKASELKWF